MATRAGRELVEMVWRDRSFSRFVTQASLKNAVVLDMALSGSTNSLIHLIAMARRLDLSLTLDDFAAAGDRVPVICNLMPAGKYLMEDLHFAGGLAALAHTLREHLDLSAENCLGGTLGEVIERAEVWNPDVIRPLDNPVYPSGGLAVVRGSLAPRGAIIKRSAASPELLKHTGPALVFRNHRDLMARIDNPELDVTAESVLVLQDAGPTGAPGMPEWGMLPVPKKLLQQGITDVVRISDARMSGTSYGTCILHVCPESRIGGPLALVEDGDLIALDAFAGTLDLLVDPEMLERRRQDWRPPEAHYSRGYGALYLSHVTQADEGCDFDFLALSGHSPDPEIH
jgi:dihydroxy-acid dehydratase